jgi:hypothetical protein
VTNPAPARQLSAGETDDEVRRRARGALSGRLKGTPAALRFALLSLEGPDGAPALRDVKVQEFPNGVPGEVRVDIAYADDSPATKARVLAVIEETRPVGVRVIAGEASKLRVRVRAQLTLSGAGVDAAALASLTSGVEARVAAYLAGIEAGGRVRRAKLAALALSDVRIVDAELALIPDGQSAVEEIALASGQVIEVIRPFEFPTASVEAPAAGLPASFVRVSATLPIHLKVGISESQATDAIQLSLAAYLATRRHGVPLTLESLAAAIRDDSRFALVREEAALLVESDGRFLQLTDGIGSFDPEDHQSFEKGIVAIEVREGRV